MPGTGHRRISMTKEVIVKISGFQLLDGEQDAVEIITAGDYYQKNGRHYIVYEEAMEGFEGSTRNIVKVSPQKMDIMKTGIVNAHMVFEKNQKATTRYPHGGDGGGHVYQSDRFGRAGRPAEDLCKLFSGH